MGYFRFISAIVLLVVLLIQVGCKDDKKNDMMGPDPCQAMPFLGCQTVNVIQFGSSVNGALATSDCVSSGTFADLYQICLSESRAMTIDLTSASFDAVLGVFDRATGNLIVDDDDGGNGSNSKIITVLSPGTYIIVATSFSEAEVGSYNLSIK